MREGVNIAQIILSDFKPGIMSDYHATAGQSRDTTRGYLNGGATVANTYRCCADPSGALGPLPHLRLARSFPLLPNGNVNVDESWYPGERQAAYAMDVTVYGPPDNTLVLYQYYWSDSGIGDGDHGGYNWYVNGIMYFAEGHVSQTGSGEVYLNWIFAKQNGPGTGGFELLEYDPDNPEHFFPLFSGGLDQTISIHQDVDDPAQTPHFDNLSPIVVAGFSGMTTFRSEPMTVNEESGGTVNYDSEMTVVASGYSEGFATNDDPTNVLNAFPRMSPREGDFSGRYDVFAHRSELLFPLITQVCTHQGRALGVAQYANFRPPRIRTDVLWYMPAIDFEANDDGTSWSRRKMETLSVGEESVSPIGVIASISSDELLIVKHRNGGYVVRGDVDNPTVQRLPFIESTAGVSSYPVHTPIGLAYGTRNGVFVYTGGEQSEKISSQLDGFFWDHRDHLLSPTGQYPEFYTDIVGRFGYLHPWIATPNNYLYDTRIKSWWRIETPDPVDGPIAFNCYAQTTNDKLRCVPYKLTPTRNEAFYELDPAVLASSYSWQSQPLFESRDRLITIKELCLVAQAAGVTNSPTVRITLTGHNPDGSALEPVVTDFTLITSPNPQQIIKPVVVNFTALHVQVRIEAADTDNAPAPKVISLRITTDDRAEVRAAT